MRWALVSLCGISLISFLCLLFGVKIGCKKSARVSIGCIAGIWEAGLDFWT
jgi:hypothetical protein